MNGRVLVLLGAALGLWLIPLGAEELKNPEVSITEFPKSIRSGETFRVRVDFQLGKLCRENRRAVAILELRDAADGQVIKRWVEDNAGYGLRAPLERLILKERVEVAMPTSTYFVAYLAPFGMNERILEEIARYPSDGSIPYVWQGGGSGHTQDLYYLGQEIFPGSPKGTTYCCGLTYEIFLNAYNRYNRANGHTRIGTLDVDEMKLIRDEWYGSLGSMERQVVARLMKEGLGIEIEDKTMARPGDFMQIWRHSGSGHSVIFIDWIREDGKITGVKYWSAQPATKGIGYNTESIGPPKGVKWDRSYIARLRKPRDARDRLDRYADTDTRTTPTSIRP